MNDERLAEAKQAYDGAVHGRWVFPCRNDDNAPYDLLGTDSGYVFAPFDDCGSGKFCAFAHEWVPEAIAEIARLRAALKPFAEAGKGIPKRCKDLDLEPYTPGINITVAQWRAAAEACDGA